MKARWLKSVVEHSKEAAPALPYQRQVRRRGRRQGPGDANDVASPRSLKSA
ncbi:hypothetical protein [Roseovarius ramblicola]|uniref:Uncharacterized protein n=1 Tax=Roseovarius ramblicola TaxID=2022336 RepID=A0ABV5HWQ8_9RHOB